MKRVPVYLFVCIFFFSSIGLIYSTRDRIEIPHLQPAQQKDPNKKETWIVVFVHGIMSVKPHLTSANFLRFMNDKVEHTTYHKTVELMRNDSHFCCNQAMQGFGLQKIDITDTTPGNASAALGNIFSIITDNCYPDRPVESHYYTFGWSALLSPKQRYYDAKNLFIALEEERKKFNAIGIEPKIKVIGYSHGGNVVLNLGAVHERAFPTSTLQVDEAILIGMPVQKETDDLINDSVFKKIYHIFSTGDHIQKLDFFSFNRFFSRRIFKERGKRIKLPQKLVQIQLKITRPSIKTRTNPKRFQASFDFSNAAILSGRSHLLRDTSPGHAELWFFGWTPKDYRENFALRPLPSIAVAPFLMHTLEQLEAETDPTKPVIIDVRPEHGIAVIKNTKGKRFYAVKNFVSPEIFKQLSDLALSYKPDTYTDEIYEQHIQEAFAEAKKYYQDHWSKTPHRVRRRKILARLAEAEKKEKLLKEQPLLQK